MYDRYGREDRGSYVRASMDDGPLPPPPRRPSGQGATPPQQPPKPPPSPPPKPGRPPEISFGKGILDALHLDDLDTGDLLLLFLLFFLFKQKADEELLIASRDLEKTVNGMIFVEHQPPVTPEELERKLTLLNDALEKTMRTEDVSCIREVLHRVVPTFHEPEEVNRTQGETVEIPEQEPACS